MFEVTLADRKIFTDELADFLPPKIFDAHVHIFTAETCRRKFSPREYQSLCGGKFDFDDWRRIIAELLPGREVHANIFGTPDPATDRAAADAGIGRHVDGDACFGMALTSPEDSPDAIARRIRDNRLVGYKPYWKFVRGIPADDIRICDMLPDALLEQADARRWIITLHIPRPGRLADPVNRRDMADICRRYPGAAFIFAHIGRAYYRSGVEGFLDGLAACPNAWVDTAMVNHEWVLEYTFRHFPRERILFGSDAPVAMLRGKSVEVNHQYAYLMGQDCAIGSSIYDPACPIVFTFFYYEQLRGLKYAARAAGLTRREIENIFFRNASDLFTAVYNHNYPGE